VAIDDVLRAFEDYGIVERGAGWRCHCPCHDDSTPSLDIDEGEAGRILIRCRAGCETGDVLAAVGLKWPDLFDGPGSRLGSRRPQGPIEMSRRSSQSRHLKIMA
jgi:hypothetical protein